MIRGSGQFTPAVVIVACLLMATACQAGSPPTRGRSASAVTAQMNPPTGPSLPKGTNCPESPIPLGIYAVTIRPEDLAKLPPALAPFGSGFLGRWEIHVGVADPNCYYTYWAVLRQGGEVKFVDAHPFTVIGPDEIALHGAGEPVGTYKVFSKGRSIRFQEISDPSTGRPQVATIGGPWILQPSGP